MAKRKRLVRLFAVLKNLYEKDLERYEKTKKDADDIARISANSPSQSGDRIHSQGQADIANAKAQRTKMLIEELKGCLEDDLSQVNPPCYIHLRDGNVTLELFLVKNMIEIPDFKLVSDESVLGKSLLGKRKTDKVKVGENTFEIVIIE